MDDLTREPFYGDNPPPARQPSDLDRAGRLDRRPQIRAAMQRQGVSYAELASRVKSLSVAQLEEMLTQRRPLASETEERIARHLDINLEYGDDFTIGRRAF